MVEQLCVRLHTDCTDPHCDVHVFGPYATAEQAYAIGEKLQEAAKRYGDNALVVVTELMKFEDMF